MLLLFFALLRAFTFFLFKAKTTLLVLWLYIHVQHLASLCRICGDKIEDHKRKVDTNHFVSEIHQIWKDLLLLDSPTVRPQLKQNFKKREISTVNNVFRYSLEMH